MPPGLRALCVAEDATVRAAMLAVDSGGATICLVLTEDGRLAGVVTDGDLRRALLHGAEMSCPVAPFVQRAPHTVAPEASRSHVLDLMRALQVNHLPVVEPDGTVVGLHTLNSLVGRAELPNVAVIMAGGRGTRLGDLTQNRPKPLMTVAGRPIIEWMMLELIGAGISTIYVSVGHLAEQIEGHLGDGSALGCEVRYLREEPRRLLGTAGALAMLADAEPGLAHPVLVANADLMVRFAADEMIAHHVATGASITVAARPYVHTVPFGVLDLAPDGQVRSVTEKPAMSAQVSAGIYVVSPEVVRSTPRGEPATMPQLMQACLERGARVGTWALESDWIDVGTPVDLARAKGQ
nr:sugar phosphate nucleotidyltransferase [Motilibacter deserti]